MGRGARRRSRSRARPRRRAAGEAGPPGSQGGHARGRAQPQSPAARASSRPTSKGRSYPLGDEITVGRAAGCQVTLDDTYVSQLHARVFARDGQLFVEDLGSTNGTYLNRQKVAGPMVMQPGDRLQVGNTVLELA